MKIFMICCFSVLLLTGCGKSTNADELELLKQENAKLKNELAIKNGELELARRQLNDTSDKADNDSYEQVSATPVSTVVNQKEAEKPNNENIVDSKLEKTEQNEVTVKIASYAAYDRNVDIYKYTPFVEMDFEVTNNTSQDIKGVQGLLDIYDIFGELIKTIGCDFDQQIIPAGQTVVFDDLIYDTNVFNDEDNKLLTSTLDNLEYKYKITKVIYN